ncbi:MAG: hypothetical protein K9J85_04110 [Desulfobacteraceae bacterium]|nr:hypothetical protein [Desulfobacteraceae bacterium]
MIAKSDFACKCGCGKNLIKDEIIDMCKNIEKQIGMPLTINSGYRCATHNSNVGGTTNSQHLSGNAADISCSNINKLKKVCKKCGRAIKFKVLVYTQISYTWITEREEAGPGNLKIKEGTGLKKLIFIFFFVILIPSCSLAQEHNEQLKKEIIELVKSGRFDEISDCGLGEKKKEPGIKEFTDPQQSLDAMKRALNEGYLPLLEDISKGKYACIEEKEILDNYKFADWETRNIGFANWPLRVEGALLLQQIEILKNQILIMKLCNEKELRPFIKKKQKSLKKAINKLDKMTKQENWVD